MTPQHGPRGERLGSQREPLHIHHLRRLLERLLVTLNLAIGQQTPPVASVLITACSIAKADVWEVAKVNLPFIAVLSVVRILVTYAPLIPLALVELFYR